MSVCKIDAIRLAEFDPRSWDMANKENGKYTLVNKDDRKAVLMKSGQPFIYSSRELATIGKRALEAERKLSLLVVSV